MQTVRVPSPEVPPVPRPEYDLAYDYLHEPDVVGVLVSGPRAAGTSTMLRMLRDRLEDAGEIVLYRGAADGPMLAADLVDQFERAARTTSLGDGLIRRRRGRAGWLPDLGEMADQLRGADGPTPVLIFDSLGDQPDPAELPAVLSALEYLTHTLAGWRFVFGLTELPPNMFLRLPGFQLVELLPLGRLRTDPLLRRLATELDSTARTERQPRDDAALGTWLHWLITPAIARAEWPKDVDRALEDLALAGGRETVRVLADRSNCTPGRLRELLETDPARMLVRMDDSGGLPGTAQFLDEPVAEYFRTRLVLKHPFRVADLAFGAEAAEFDRLLDSSFVRRPFLEDIAGGSRSRIVGGRGSGKSAVFRELAALPPGKLVMRSATDSGDLLQRIIDPSSANTETLRAAWLVVIAALATDALPNPVPKQLRHAARELRQTFGLPIRRAALRRGVARLGRMIGGTTLTFSIGPATLSAQLPSQAGVGASPTTRTARSATDVKAFLEKLDSFLKDSDRRFFILFDRIDENFMYDRQVQQKLIQALLQAESAIALMPRLGVMLFLRTDLLELSQPQEISKAVSRTFEITWSPTEWLQVLARRALANPALQHLAERLRTDRGTVDARAVLELLFPREIEGEAVEHWLLDSLSNGNGHIQPRLAVLFLYYAREYSPAPHEPVSALPVFSSAAATQAMDRIAELCFNEIIDDFKVAPTFVNNCRTAMLSEFTQSKVEHLFAAAEGEASEQTRLLARLGFLRRVVGADANGPTASFEIPRLYSRHWLR